MKLAMWVDKTGPYLLTNENLVVGDKVFPLADTYHTAGQVFITGLPRPTDVASHTLACTGWPSEPHTVLSFYQREGIRWIRTDKGYSPAEAYFRYYRPYSH